MNTNDAVNEIFEKLDEWRNLPSYQLERRADIFFAIYLKEILSSFFPEADCEKAIIVPEFPYWKQKQDPETNSNPSHIDYAVFIPDRTEKKLEWLIFIELKTDMSTAQNAKSKAELLEYKHLINKTFTVLMRELNCLIALKRPKREREKYRWLDSVLPAWIRRLSVVSNTRIIYIIPKKMDDKHHKNIVDAIGKELLMSIDFEQVRTSLNNNITDDAVKTRFLCSLKKWETAAGTPTEKAEVGDCE